MKITLHMAHDTLVARARARNGNRKMRIFFTHRVWGDQIWLPSLGMVAVVRVEGGVSGARCVCVLSSNRQQKEGDGRHTVGVIPRTHHHHHHNAQHARGTAWRRDSPHTLA